MTHKKTVCFFNSNRAWGGGEKWHFNTAKDLAHRGHKTFLVTNVASELEKKASKESVLFYPFRVSNLSFLNPLKILLIASFFFTKKVDALILNLPSDLKLAGVAAKIAGVKKIIYRRGMPHPLRNTALNRFLFKNVLTHIIVNSKEVERSLVEGNESWFPKEKIFLLHNGVDTQIPLFSERKLYQKNPNEVVIGNAGRLTEQKGQKYLIEMASILKSQNLNFQLLIAGEGELRTTLAQEIKKQGLDNEVKLLGHVDDMPAFLNSLDIFVFPSLFEGSANTLIETLHHRIPTVAFNLSSNPEIIEDGKNGFLTEPKNAQDLANSVKRLIDSPELMETFKNNGDATIRGKFDSRKNLDRLEGLLNG
ncbi:MAG: glycosyltransferase [Bacteriovoracaceae bacterium]